MGEATVDRDIFALVKQDLKDDEYKLLANDFDKRSLLGTEVYGDRMRAYDGRNAMQDAYEEALDLAAYLRKQMVEHPGNGTGALFRQAVYLACQIKKHL